MQHSSSATAGAETDERLLMLSPQDNVAVVLRALSAGEWIRVKGSDVEIPMHIAMGHKIALVVIRRGEQVIKYGAPIGSATADISVGNHVHLHNICSNHTPSHSLEAARQDQADDI